MKVQITLDDKLVDRLDLYADDNYMSRSGLISLFCSQGLNQAEAYRYIKEMSFCMRKIADSGQVDDDTRHKLEDFERFANLLSSN